MADVKRGDIYWVNLDPVVGTEVGKRRPALIISNDVGNKYSDRVIVAPITNKGLTKVYPIEVLLLQGEGGVPENSKVVLDQIRAIDKQRLADYIGRLDADKMKDVDRALRKSLAL